MLNSKFYRVYTHLGGRERAEFADYVRFRQHSSKQPLTHLLELIEAASVAENQAFSKESIYGKLLPNEAFNPLRFNNYLSDLFSLLKDYLVQCEIADDEGLQRKLLRKAWKGMGLNKFFEGGIRDELSRMEKDARTQHHFRRQHEVMLEADQYYINQATKKDYTYLRESAHALEIYYLEENLRCYCELLNRRQIVGIDFDEEAMTHFLRYMERRADAFAFTPFIKIYATLLDCLLEPEDDANYDRLELMLTMYLKELPDERAKELCYNAQNFCVRRINAGREEYLERYFELLKIMLKDRLIFDGAYLSQWNYKNITTVGLRLEALEWTQDFVDSYKEYLAPNGRENAYSYNRAAVDYAMGNYDSAMQLVNDVRFDDPTYYLGSKSMLLKIYYELEEFDALTNLCDSFRIYLLRNKKQLAKIHPDLYTNLVRYTLQLAKLRHQRSYRKEADFNKTWMGLYRKVSDNKRVGNKQWLLAQLELLKPVEVDLSAIKES